MERTQKIVRTSIVGIITNFVLVGFKAMVGIISGSIAIALDALNNLTDAVSSIVTIIGAKLADKAPDKKHPYGYGRIEYFSSMIVAAIVLYAGVTAVVESIQKIFVPSDPSYSIALLVIIAIAVLVKIILGRYVKVVGKKLNSQSLVASGTDALMDAILSFSTLVAAIISFIWNVHLEGYLGVVIAAFIIKAAIEMMIEPMHAIIGVRADKADTAKLRKLLMKYPEVQGVYDLTLHNYGPEKAIATVHIQIPDKMTAREIHALTRQMTYDIYEKYGIITTIGIYAANGEGKYGELRKTVESITKQYKVIKQMHGFYVDKQNNVFFDLIIDFECQEPEKIQAEIIHKLTEQYPRYKFNIILDADVAD